MTVEEALAQAREDLRESAERAAEAAKAERRRARRARKEAEWQSGEVESPIFAIAQAGVAKEVEEAAPRARAKPMFKAKDAAELQAAMRTQGGLGELPAPSISSTRRASWSSRGGGRTRLEPCKPSWSSCPRARRPSSSGTEKATTR